MDETCPLCTGGRRGGRGRRLQPQLQVTRGCARSRARSALVSTRHAPALRGVSLPAARLPVLAARTRNLLRALCRRELRLRLGERLREARNLFVEARLLLLETAHLLQRSAGRLRGAGWRQPAPQHYASAPASAAQGTEIRHAAFATQSHLCSLPCPHLFKSLISRCANNVTLQALQQRYPDSSDPHERGKRAQEQDPDAKVCGRGDCPGMKPSLSDGPKSMDRCAQNESSVADVVPSVSEIETFPSG